MSLHEIFDHIWNFPIRWLWILGAIGAIWFVVFIVGLIIANEVREEGRPK
jgi:hypothetical protein